MKNYRGALPTIELDHASRPHVSGGIERDGVVEQDIATLGVYCAVHLASGVKVGYEEEWKIDCLRYGSIWTEDASAGDGDVDRPYSELGQLAPRSRDVLRDGFVVLEDRKDEHYRS